MACCIVSSDATSLFHVVFIVFINVAIVIAYIAIVKVFIISFVINFVISALDVITSYTLIKSLLVKGLFVFVISIQTSLLLSLFSSALSIYLLDVDRGIILVCLNLV